MAWIERNMRSQDTNNVTDLVLYSYFHYMQKYLHMKKAYESHQVKHETSYYFRNKEYGPIVPYLSTGIKLCVAFTKLNIDLACWSTLGYLFYGQF